MKTSQVLINSSLTPSPLASLKKEVHKRLSEESIKDHDKFVNKHMVKNNSKSLDLPEENFCNYICSVLHAAFAQPHSRRCNCSARCCCAKSSYLLSA